MEGFNPLPVIIPLAALIVGWLIGFFDSNMRSSKKIKEADARAQAAINDAKAKLDQAVAAAAASLGRDSLLRLSLDQTGRPQLDLDGQPANVAALSPEQRKRLIELMVTMRPWIEAAPSTSTAQPRPAPQPAPRPAPPAAAAPAWPQPGTVPAAPAGPPEIAAPTTMVGQIDAILQAKLAGSSLAARGVRLIESPDGGVSVMVGLQRFAGVGEVPDAEVQAAIRAAIAEWEKRFTPGV